MQVARAESQPKGVPQPVLLTTTTSGYLDAIRALAALAVMLGHCRGFFFVDYETISPGRTTPAVKAIYAATGFGHQAVMVFFVLSGFLISSSLFRSLGQAKAWGIKYAIDRSVRLYLVLVPGLVLGLVWDLAGIVFLNGSGIYSSPLIPFGNRPPTETLSLGTFVGNLLFLQTRFTPVFGSNGPLWSLFNEFWYYALFPVLIAAMISARQGARADAVRYVLLAAAIAWVVGPQLGGFVVWLAGGAVAFSSHYLRFSNWRTQLLTAYTLGAGSIFAGCLVASRTGTRWFGSDLAVGFSFALVVHGILQLEIPIGTMSLGIAKKFAGVSYSLYVLHFPMLYFVRAWWLPHFRWQPDAVHLMYGVAISALAVLYAFAIAWMTEGKTPIVRAWVRDKVL